jgi:hypothetical protein
MIAMAAAMKNFSDFIQNIELLKVILVTARRTRMPSAKLSSQYVTVTADDYRGLHDRRSDTGVDLQRVGMIAESV